jgi:hypothetical protein
LFSIVLNASRQCSRPPVADSGTKTLALPLKRWPLQRFPPPGGCAAAVWRTGLLPAKAATLFAFRHHRSQSGPISRPAR